MRKALLGGWVLSLAFAFAIPTLTSVVAEARGAKAKSSEASSEQQGAALTKDEQQKLREHMKLRNEITRVKYPAAKADIVASVKGVKADDKKWFDDTLPDRTYSSPEEVFSALGWQIEAPADPASAGAAKSRPAK